MMWSKHCLSQFHSRREASVDLIRVPLDVSVRRFDSVLYYGHMQASALIPPATRVHLKALRLSARLTPGGQSFGAHASHNRGAGLEFAQYRAYEPGDEPRHIDWKLYARSDRFFVRDASRDSPLTVWPLIDSSASMAQADEIRPDFRKLDAARALAACIAELAVQQGDNFGLASAGESIQVLQTGAGSRHRSRLWLALDRLQCGGIWPDAEQLRPLWQVLPARSLIVFLSDGFDDNAVHFIEQLASARSEVLSIQILTAEERDFPFRGGQIFRDPETGAERRVDAPRARTLFLQRFSAARAALAQRMAAAGIRHVEYVLDEPLHLALQRLLGGRA